MLKHFLPFIILLMSACVHYREPVLLPAEGLIDLGEVDPFIPTEIRYAGHHNFMGRPVQGYLSPRCLLTRAAAEALRDVQTDLEPQSLSLKIYDCYRPQRAVNDFVEWAKDARDTKMKAEFYPSVDKRNLFRDGYIATRSGHSRGSTVDLTLVPLPQGDADTFEAMRPLVSCTRPYGTRFRDASVDMGTGFDCFDKKSQTLSPAIGETARQNRERLKQVMEKHGFKNYDKEWWHYTLKNEPFPDTYFDVPIE